MTLDGHSTEYEGFTGGLDTPAYQLVSAPDLALGQHHIHIVNIGDDPTRLTFDFDYVRTSN